ncbi:MAG: carboxypeptidase-like regulatory domain-containing protein, partial [Muribaculaceae bacterium]|nr:carboxypeptidase-like regulatory domain-containing protein [Muribaculaceae bacterium]
MKRLFTMILLLCSLAGTAHAQRITRNFQSVSMSDALKYIQQQTSSHKIVFIYNELEDFTVTTHVKNKPVPYAIRQIIGFYPIQMILGDNNDIYVECIHKTEHHLKGMVVDENNLPLPYANVTLLSPADSSMVGGGVTNESGRFVIPNDHGKVIARVSYVGYKTEHRLCARDNVGTIKLQPDATRINEVVVTAKKAKVTRDGLNYSISNLSGTHIGDAGTLYDMLGWTPGIITYDINNIKAGGSTSVGAIYVNEQKVTDRNILLSIPSNQVSKIEVIRDLGVRYSAESGAVIKITLKKQLKDYMGVSVTNNLEIRRRVSDDGWVNLSGKYGKFSFSGSLVGQYVNRKADYKGGTVVFGADETPAYRDVFDSKYTSVRTGPLWSVGLNYLAKPTLNFIIQYSGSSTNVDFNEMKIHQLLMNGAESTLEENKSIPHRKSSGHNLTSGFTYFSPTGHFFNATISYSRQNNGETQFVDIFNTVDNIPKQKNIASNSIYDLLDAEANWRFS